MLTDIFIPIKCRLINPLIQDLERQILYNMRLEIWVIYELVLGMKVNKVAYRANGSQRKLRDRAGFIAPKIMEP